MPTPEDVKNWEDQEGEVVDMAQAYRELARGEQTAAALEANLSSLHSRLDAMLAGLEPKEEEAVAKDASPSGGAAAAATTDKKPQGGDAEGKK